MTALLTPKRLLPVLLMLAVSACSSDSRPPLEGDRISVLELERALEPDDVALDQQGLITPAPWKNAFWPQTGGYPNHSMQNLELSDKQLQRVWSANIGKGSSRRIPLNAQPIVVDGQIFTLNADFGLSAFDIKNGRKIWETDIRNKHEDDNVISGGLSYASGVIYVTNGYNEVLAVDPKDGNIFWRANTGSPSRAAPTIMDNRLYVLTVDNRLLALNAGTGAQIWEYVGLSETAGLIGAASPAANHSIVVPAFSSGEISALRVENGSVAWSDNLSSVRALGGLAGISDIRALPVIDKGLVFAISFGGRLVAIDERTGQRIWQREIGGSHTPWVAGNHVFVLTSDNQVVALGRETGSIRWVTRLRNDKDEPFFMTGPVLAGGRLILAGHDGTIIEIDPNNGDIINQWNSGLNVVISPIVAGGVLYLLGEDGTLNAYK